MEKEKETGGESPAARKVKSGSLKVRVQIPHFEGRSFAFDEQAEDMNWEERQNVFTPSEIRAFLSVSPYLTEKGKGWIIRPYADARGGAHPRYMRRDEEFISLSPHLKIASEEEAIWTFISSSLEGEIRQTRRGVKFLALFKRSEERDNIPLLIDQVWDGEFAIPDQANKGLKSLFVSGCEDSTATGASSVETIMVLAEDGFFVEKRFYDGDPDIYRLRSGKWVIICSDDYITADELEDLY